MVNPYKDRFVTAFTRRAQDGLFREILVPLKVRIPNIFPKASHDLFEVEAIWDTGATNSVISESLAQKMSILPTGMTKVKGIHDEKLVPTYIVDIILNDKVAFEKWRVTSGDLGQGSVQFLIGMDIIANGDSAISQELNNDGKPCTVFTFRYPSIVRPNDYVEEINRYKAEEERKAKRSAAAKAFKKKRRYH